ncbi:NAD-dependent epimerase/dehydratase family protein [Caballeronia telluris]|uniref:NAD-dependent epimerase/dehydratase n=1 Tax=Caballeronia telluris TaxID=326475 RepID=A0A158J714_9BURK|nr:NAD(P)-dependent oxidoreductase [Caballeronia telluris]SAL64608.1 NAD-dependent epimerase/dehydratase [Caballeronia telluris]
MDILFSGGTGFFGKAVLRYLIAHEREAGALLARRVVVLSRAPDLFLRRHPEFAGLPWLSFHRGDIEVPDSLPRDAGFTHILHAAADSTHVADLRPLQRFEQITQGTKNLLQYAADHGVRRFLLTSSGGVYGPQPASMNAIPERYHGMPDPLDVAGTYGVGKRQAEHLCALYGERFGMECVIARCFAFVGEDLPLDVHFAIGNFIADALWRDEIVVKGDGTPVRSYMDQTELARWLLVMLREGKAGHAYNVGSPEAMTLGDAAHRIATLLSPGKPVRILAKPDADNATRNRYVPDVLRAATELDLHNEIDFDQAILRAGGIIGRRASMT